MTKALDAAVRAAEEAIEDPKRYAKYEDVARCIMCAALTAEPPAEAVDVMVDAMAADDTSFASMSIAAYRALRAHLLGEDA